MYPDFPEGPEVLGTGRPIPPESGGLVPHWPTGTCKRPVTPAGPISPLGPSGPHGSRRSVSPLGPSAPVFPGARSSLRGRPGPALVTPLSPGTLGPLGTGVSFPQLPWDHGEPSRACISLGGLPAPAGCGQQQHSLYQHPALPEILLIAIPHVSSPFCTYANNTLLSYMHQTCTVSGVCKSGDFV